MLEKLTNAFGVSGCDDEIRDIILAEISPYADKIDITKDGNIIAFKKGKKPTKKKVMISAHTDEVGFMVKDITKDGYLKLCSVGGIDSRILLSKKVYIGKNKIPGIIGIKAVHLTKKEEREEKVPLSDLYVDIGALCREDALKYVEIGDYILFDGKYEKLGENRIKAKALDDRVGVMALIDLIKRESEYDFYAVFNSLEEIGLKGAMTASYKVNPDIALILEGTTCSDVLGTKENEQSTCLLKGAVLSIADGVSVSNRSLNEFIIKLAKENDVPLQFKRTNTGGNDAGSIQTAKDGVQTAVISLPTRYIHSPVSVMDLRDFESYKKITELFTDNIGGFEID